MKFLICHAQCVQIPPSIYFYTWTKFCPKKFRWSVKCWLLSPAVCLHVTVSHLRIINLLHALMTALLESGTFSVAMRREFFEVCFQKSTDWDISERENFSCPTRTVQISFHSKVWHHFLNPSESYVTRISKFSTIHNLTLLSRWSYLYCGYFYPQHCWNKLNYWSDISVSGFYKLFQKQSLK